MKWLGNIKMGENMIENPLSFLLHLHESTFNKTRNKYVLKVKFLNPHLLDGKFVVGELLTQNVRWFVLILN